MGDDGGAAAELRERMVAGLRERGALVGERVAAAMARVPRHLFVPGVELADAYADQAIVTHYRDGWPSSSASQPAIVAIMLEQLGPPGGGRVLEIGAGTGYNAALLADLVGPSGRVVTVDIDPEVADEARRHLAAAGVGNAEVIRGDGASGWREGAPYDGIIVTAGASDLAPAWTEQLAPTGRLVLPLSIRGVQQCVTFTRAGGHLRSVAVYECGFMPLAGAMASGESRKPVPGHPHVYVLAAGESRVDTGAVAGSLDRPGPRVDTAVTAVDPEVCGSLLRWLAFHDRDAAALSYHGPAEGADESGVPPVLEFTFRGGVSRSAPCLLGPAGLAIVDVAAAPRAAGEPAGPAAAVPGAAVALAVRGYGEAERETARLRELIAAWDAEGRPSARRLRIDAYPAGPLPPDVPGTAYAARHTTFAVSAVAG
jgi:protein-L-isoaspartate(D-aspartate) O-methyltransferase